MPWQVDETGQLKRVEEELIRRFGDQLSEDRICAEVARTVSRYENAKVRTFVPVLVQHEVMLALRRTG